MSTQNFATQDSIVMFTLKYVVYRMDTSRGLTFITKFHALVAET